MAKGGRAGYEREVRRTIEDMISGDRGGVPTEVLDPSQFGAMLDAEDYIRGLDREVALVYEDIAQEPVGATRGTETSVGLPPVPLYGRSMTHNHPDRRHGGTFSFPDVGVGTTNELQRLRATATEGNYYMMPRQNANPLGLNMRVASDIPKLNSRMQRASDRLAKQAVDGEITWGQARGRARQVVTGVLHRYYKQVAPEYGYAYGRQKLNSTRRRT